jgi:hypothetical protein
MRPPQQALNGDERTRNVDGTPDVLGIAASPHPMTGDVRAYTTDFCFLVEWESVPAGYSMSPVLNRIRDELRRRG